MTRNGYNEVEIVNDGKRRYVVEHNGQRREDGEPERGWWHGPYDSKAEAEAEAERFSRPRKATKKRGKK